MVGTSIPSETVTLRQLRFMAETSSYEAKFGARGLLGPFAIYFTRLASAQGFVVMGLVSILHCVAHSR